VPLLARHLLAEIAVRQGRAAPELRKDALDLLSSQPWPGNVRELSNVLERAAILADTPRLGADDLRPLLHSLAGAGEAQRLRQALVDARGDKRRAAEILGVSYRTVLRWVKEQDLEGFPRYR
jgi:DNA-binding NtrC family response regulator